jgi:hypothetical protein
MPRVTHVKSARKDNPVCQKGEPYFWWKFRYGGKRYSLTRPKPSQLTQSEYLSNVYGLQEQIESWGSITNEDDLEMFKDEIRGALEELRDQTEENRENMPESLQESPTGELLQERYDALDEAANEIDSLDADSMNWSEVADAEAEHEAWVEREPNPSSFLLEVNPKEAHADAHEDWAVDEPDEPDELEEFDLAEAADVVSNAII